ncbi:MAG: aminopeptidase P family protein [Candidatus Bathyarchaeota archaeon]|nr:MAG: aminopeptidase P family protein [Candidatus Bathyarchaeota archaeon]
MKRINKLKTVLEKGEIDGYLTMNVKNIYYFTEYMDISNAHLNLIIPVDNSPILLTPPLSYVAASEDAKECHIKNIGAQGKFFENIVKEIRELKMKKIVFDALTMSLYLKLVKEMKNTHFNYDPSIVAKLRRKKDNKELGYIRKAAALTDKGVEAGLEAVKPGIHEYEIAAEIEYAMRIRGSKGTAFETVVASGPRSAYPHGVCSDRIIRKGDLVILDLGAIYSGYCCDITRTKIVGNPSSKQLRMFNAVKKAHEEAFKTLRAGIKTRDVDAVARTVLAKEKLDKFFIHGLGHGIGLEIHEAPTLSSRSNETLEVRNVVSNEPGIYIQGFGGVRIEDTVLIHKNCGENLTKATYH